MRDLRPNTFRTARRARRGWLASAMALATLVAPAGATAADRAAEAERLRELLRLAPGRTVADVGAGRGEWTIGLAEAVGANGRVWATEVDPELVAAIRDEVAEEKLPQVEIVLGDERSTGLPAGCCDAILLRLVYHHLKEPAPILADLARALRPGGVVVMIETIPQTDWRQLEGVPERGGHGIALERLLEEVATGGFESTEVVDRWNGDPERFAVVLRRRGGG